MRGNIDFISAASILFPVIAAFMFYSRLGREYTLIFIFFVMSFATEVAAHILKTRLLNNLWLINIFTLIECFFLALILRQWLASEKIRKFILIFLGVYFIAWVYTTFFYLDFYHFNNYIRTVESITFVFLSCFLLISVSTDTSISIFRNPKFWFGSALLIYFSVNLIVFGSVNLILSDHSHLMKNTWTIHSVTNILANLLYATGFLCMRQKVI